MCGTESEPHISTRPWYLDAQGTECGLCCDCAHRLENSIISGDIIYYTPDEQPDLIGPQSPKRLSRHETRQLRCRYARYLEWEINHPLPPANAGATPPNLNDYYAIPHRRQILPATASLRPYAPSERAHRRTHRHGTAHGDRIDNAHPHTYDGAERHGLPNRLRATGHIITE